MTGTQAATRSQDERPLAERPKSGAIASSRDSRGVETVFVIEDDISVREALCGDEQAGGESPWPEPGHGEDVPGSSHEEDGGKVPGRAREDGGGARLPYGRRQQ